MLPNKSHKFWCWDHNAPKKSCRICQARFAKARARSPQAEAAHMKRASAATWGLKNAMYVANHEDHKAALAPRGGIIAEGVNEIPEKQKPHYRSNIHRNTGAKRMFTEDEVRAIRRAHDKGESTSKIAARLGCHEQTIYQIVSYMTYNNVVDKQGDSV